MLNILNKYKRVSNQIVRHSIIKTGLRCRSKFHLQWSEGVCFFVLNTQRKEHYTIGLHINSSKQHKIITPEEHFVKEQWVSHKLASNGYVRN